MKKITIYMLLLLIVVGCSFTVRNSNLEDAISSIVLDETKNEISVNSLTDFDWEKAFLFTPYFPETDMKEMLGTEFFNLSCIDYRDDIYLLVFLKEGEVVQYAEMERHSTNFSLGEKKHLTPTDNVISIQRY